MTNDEAMISRETGDNMDDVCNEFLDHIKVPMKLRDKCSMCGRDRSLLDKLEKQNQVMHKALKYYADQDNSECITARQAMCEVDKLEKEKLWKIK
jgi:hypothetical protein